MRWAGAIGILGLMLASGCGAVMSSAGVPYEQADVQIKDLRQQQVDALYQFDGMLLSGGNLCVRLCRSHTQICTLATRICDIAKDYEGHDGAESACRAATTTCRETNQRLPDVCLCRD